MIPFAEFQDLKGDKLRIKDAPLGQLPVLTLSGGEKITQSLAISRYVGRITKLYPEDPLQALYVDELMDIVADIINNIPQNSDLAQRKIDRQIYVKAKLSTYYSYFAEKLQAKGPFFGGAKYSIADFHVYSAVKTLRTGMFDDIPAGYEEKWPAIGVFIDALEKDPSFAPYKL